MDFEFDPKKSDINKSKHGIDFYEAQALWDDPDLIEIPLKSSVHYWYRGIWGYVFLTGRRSLNTVPFSLLST